MEPPDPEVFLDNTGIRPLYLGIYFDTPSPNYFTIQESSLLLKPFHSLH